MGKFFDISGLIEPLLMLGKGGVNLKSNNGKLYIRNTNDSADAGVVASTVELGEGGTIIRSGGSNVDITLPSSNGSPNQAVVTNGSGVWSYVTLAGGNDKPVVDTTTLLAGSTSPLAMFTLPANAVIRNIEIIVDTAFNGTPSVSIGITGNLSKYVPASKIFLDVVAPFNYFPSLPASVSSENLILTYSANSATVGSARIHVEYVIPS